MGSPRFFWVFTMAVIPTVAPFAVRGQTAGGMRSADVGRNDPISSKLIEPAPKKPPRRGRSRSVPLKEDRSATNDWNPHYLAGKEYFVAGRYDQALAELSQNVADCDRIDFEAMRRQNAYFDHVWNSTSEMGQSPHAYLRASNLQWVGAALAALGNYDQAETRFTEMENFAERCFPGRLSTFQGCSCQGLAFLLAARGHYDQAAELYRLALAHIEGNQAQIGLPPAPCVAMILVALADVELARGRLGAAEHALRRATHVQEAQHQLGIGPAPSERAALLTVFAQLRRCQFRDSEAYDLYADALAIFREIRHDHPSTGYCLDGLGEIDLSRGRLEQSEDHFREALAVRRASLGAHHREVAFSLDGLARIAAARRKTDQAESFALEARSILEGATGRAHPDGIELARYGSRRDERPRLDAKPARPRARFLAMPTFLTVGWQVLHLGKDWRVVEAKIVWQAVKDSKTKHHAAAAPGNDR